MKNLDKILIGGRALVALGSDRSTDDTDYLVNDKSNTNAFSHDEQANIDYCNANGLDFFKAIYEIEKGNQIASPQSLLELKAYAFIQHCQNFNFAKADQAEYDMKFLVRKFNLKSVKTVNKFALSGQVSEIAKIIKSVKF